MADKNTPAQGALPLALPEKERYALARFHPGTQNKLARVAVKKFIGGALGPVLVLTGKANTGKSHLLKAIYYSSRERSVFFSAKTVYAMPAESRERVFSNAASCRLVCLDDLDIPEAPDDFYQGIFSVFNSLSANGGRLAVAMRSSPAKSETLPDYLSSRLLTGMVVPLSRPDDTEKRAIISKIAADRSISLTPGAVDFILERSRRSIGELVTLIERIEHNLHPGTKRIGLQLIRRVINSMGNDSQKIE